MKANSKLFLTGASILAFYLGYLVWIWKICNSHNETSEQIRITRERINSLKEAITNIEANNDFANEAILEIENMLKESK